MTQEQFSNRLKRRIDELRQTGCDDLVLADLEQALHVVVVLEDARENDPTAAFLELVKTQRALLSRLAEVGGLVRGLPIDPRLRKHILDRIGGLLSATKEIGKGRELLAVEITPAKSRETLDAEIKALLDRKFAAVAKALEQAEQEVTDGQLPADH
jgi:hypothetical protein